MTVLLEHCSVIQRVIRLTDCHYEILVPLPPDLGSLNEGEDPSESQPLVVAVYVFYERLPPNNFKYRFVGVRIV